jgi:hypothetical protein
MGPEVEFPADELQQLLQDLACAHVRLACAQYGAPHAPRIQAPRLDAI